MTSSSELITLSEGSYGSHWAQCLELGGCVHCHVHYYWKSLLCSWSCIFLFSSSLLLETTIGIGHWKDNFPYWWLRKSTCLGGSWSFATPWTTQLKAPSVRVEPKRLLGSEDSEACPQRLTCWFSGGSRPHIHAGLGKKFVVASFPHVVRSYASGLFMRFLLAIWLGGSVIWCMLFLEMKIGSSKWNALEFHYTSVFKTLQVTMLLGLLWRLKSYCNEVFLGLQKFLLNNLQNGTILCDKWQGRGLFIFPGEEEWPQTSVNID